MDKKKSFTLFNFDMLFYSFHYFINFLIKLIAFFRLVIRHNRNLPSILLSGRTLHSNLRGNVGDNTNDQTIQTFHPRPNVFRSINKRHLTERSKKYFVFGNEGEPHSVIGTNKISNNFDVLCRPWKRFKTITVSRKMCTMFSVSWIFK